MTYRSEVVGSLLRPTYLAAARQQHEAGQINAAEFKAIEDQAVNEAIALQENAGIDVITDGEMRRYAFYGHLIDSLNGFDKYGGWAIPFRDETGEELVLKRPVVVERLKWRRSMTGRDAPQGFGQVKPLSQKNMKGNSLFTKLQLKGD